MDIGIICDINSNQPIGVIGIDKINSNVGYIVNNVDLENAIEIILNNETLSLMIKEKIEDNEILRDEELTPQHPQYLMAFNYYLPHPWKILGVHYEEGELEIILKNYFDIMEGLTDNE